jgi:pimeloyl-ACP methyl ester carboxylesterase
MRAVDYRSAPPPARCLVVFLPGMGDDAEDFAKNGLVQEVQRRKLSIDVVAANATIGYYMQGVFPERLSADVITPRLPQGYRQVWLIGNSMGGFGSLFYASQHTSEITGVLALSPYLGDDDLIDEVYAAGGLRKWRAPPPVVKRNKDNYQRELLRWLQAGTSGREAAPILEVGFGDNDKLRHADELLAAVLPVGRVYRDSGAHEWDSWHRLLTQFLDRGPLARSCSRETPPAQP